MIVKTFDVIALSDLQSFVFCNFVLQIVLKLFNNKSFGEDVEFLSISWMAFLKFQINWKSPQMFRKKKNIEVSTSLLKGGDIKIARIFSES